MIEVSPDAELAALLASFDEAGGVLDYVMLRAEVAMASPQIHRAAALAGIVAIGRRLEKRDPFFHLNWDESKLTGESITFAKFWGSDNVKPEQLGEHTWSIPDRDGYKTAFFHPPYDLTNSDDEKEILFNRINKFVFEPDPNSCEIFSWSTDWSNYFDDGHQWWGAFYWTVRSAGSDRLVVIGASSSD